MMNDTTFIKIDNNTLDKQKNKAKFEVMKLFNESMEKYDSKEEYKIHLELLARDLERNHKIQNLNHMKKKETEDQ